MRDTCRTCACYLSGGTYRGVCRRYPPVLLGHHQLAFFLLCGGDDWCGEWRGIPVSDSAARADVDVKSLSLGRMFNMRVRRIVQRYSILDVSELLKFSAGDLAGLRGMGKKSIQHIRHVLAEHGLTLKGEQLSRQCPG